MTFEQAVQIVLQHEGGYIWDKDDPGGETKYGISKRSYPNLDIKNLTKAAAVEIYRRDFWNRNKLYSYPAPVRLVMFDMMVNMGATGAGRVLQKALNHMGYKFMGTGTIGPATMKAVGEVNHVVLKPWLSTERLADYNRQVIAKPKKLKFLKGWTSRTLDIIDKT